MVVKKTRLIVGTVKCTLNDIRNFILTNPSLNRHMGVTSVASSTKAAQQVLRY